MHRYFLVLVLAILTRNSQKDKIVKRLIAKIKEVIVLATEVIRKTKDLEVHATHANSVPNW